MRTTRVILSALLIGTPLACTFVRPLDYLSAGQPADNADAADVSSDDASRTDAGQGDGAHVDGTVDTDAPNDAPVGDAPSHDGGATFCMQHIDAFFCADFEQTGVVNMGYFDGVLGTFLDDPQVSAGASAEWSDAGATRPGSIRLSSPAVDSGVTYARLNTPAHLIDKTGSTTLEFAVKVDAFDAGAIGLVTIVLDNLDGGEPARAYYELYPNTADDLISVEGTTFQPNTAPGLTRGAWHKVVFVVSVGDAGMSAELDIDDAHVRTTTPVGAQFAPAAGSSFLLGAGASVVPADIHTVTIDDILYTPH